MYEDLNQFKKLCTKFYTTGLDSGKKEINYDMKIMKPNFNVTEKFPSMITKNNLNCQ